MCRPAQQNPVQFACSLWRSVGQAGEHGLTARPVLDLHNQSLFHVASSQPCD